MATDMTAEGQPRRISRRAFLGGTAAAGALAIEEATLGLGRKGLLGNGEEATSKQEATAFDEMREVVGGAYNGTQREDLLRIVGDLEKVNARLVEFRQQDEVKDLLASTRAQFGNLDISPLLGDRYKSEQEFWEDQIPFLRDARKLREISQKVLSLPNRQDEPFALTETIVQLKKIADPAREDTDFSAYLKRDNLPQSGAKIVPVAKAPGVPFLEGTYGFPTMEKALQIAEVVSKKIPKVGEVLIYLLPVGTDYIGFGGRFFEKGKVQFNLSDRFDELRNLTLKEGQSACIVAVQNFDLERSLAHEEAHAASPWDNWPNFALNFEPKQVESSMLLSNNMNLDPKWSQLTPDSKLLFSKEMERGSIERPQSVGEPLTVRDFKLQKIAKSQLHWFSRGSLVFDKGLLDTSLLDQFAQATPPVKWYYGVEPYAGQQGDPPMVNFVNMEKERLDKWAGQDPVRKFVVGRLREEAQNLRFFTWVASSADIPYVSSPETFWKAMPTFANLFLLEAFFANNREVVEMFSPEQRKSILARIVRTQSHVIGEMNAEHLALTVTAKNVEGVKNPGLAYLENLSKAVTANNR